MYEEEIKNSDKWLETSQIFKAYGFSAGTIYFDAKKGHISRREFDRPDGRKKFYYYRPDIERQLADERSHTARIVKARKNKKF